MLDTLFTSKTMHKMLLKFFLNSNSESYLRNLETEFGESSNSIRLVLNRFETAGLLSSYIKGNRKYFQANKNHPLFSDIHSILRKHVGIDQIIERIVHKIGNLTKVFIVGDFARGIDNLIIELLFVGEQVNLEYLENLVLKAEESIKRKISFVVYDNQAFDEYFKSLKPSDHLLIWQN